MEHAVTLMEMLGAREARAMRQQQLLEEYQLPVISFCLNIAGPVKNSPVLCRAFREGAGASGMRPAGSAAGDCPSGRGGPAHRM